MSNKIEIKIVHQINTDGEYWTVWYGANAKRCDTLSEAETMYDSYKTKSKTFMKEVVKSEMITVG